MFARASLMVLVLALLTTARAGIDSVSTDSLSPGALLEIIGTDFGVKKAKVELVPFGPSGQGKSVTLKVLEHLETSITARFKKGAAGEYMLRVTPKGGDAFTAEGHVQIVLPELIALDPEDAQPGDEVQLMGRFFGEKKGKVTVGGLKAKVLAWEVGVFDGPGEIVDRILVRLSKNAKKTFNGEQLVTIKNSIGEAVAEIGLSVSGGSLATYRAKLGDDTWQADNKFGFPGYSPNGLGGISMQGFTGKPGGKSMRSLAVTLADFDPLDPPELPITIGGADVTFLVSEGVGPQGSVWQSAFDLPLLGGVENPTITITDVSDGLVSGFGQALGLDGIGGGALGTTLDVTGFVFSVPLADGL